MTSLTEKIVKLLGALFSSVLQVASIPVASMPVLQLKIYQLSTCNIFFLTHSERIYFNIFHSYEICPYISYICNSYVPFLGSGQYVRIPPCFVETSDPFAIPPKMRSFVVVVLKVDMSTAWQCFWPRAVWFVGIHRRRKGRDPYSEWLSL